MEPIELSLSSGHKVYLKPFLSFSANESITEHVQSQVLFDPNHNKVNQVPASVIIGAARRKALELLLVKVVLPDGTVAEKPFEVIGELPATVMQPVKEKVEELYLAANPTKKNLNPSE